MSTQATMCVVCEQAVAVLYCQQDEAHLCATCDHQVHSANQLASRHHRVPITQPAPEAAVQPAPEAPKTARLDEPSYSFEDDGLFAVPDVDVPSMAQDESYPYDPKALLGKDFMSDDFYMNDLDPLWLDRLDVGMDRLPSDILDSLVPEGPPAGSPPAAVVPQATAALRSADATAVDQPAAPPAPVHYVPNPHMVAYPPAAPLTAPVPIKPELAVAAIDIDNYMPRTLLPMDPAVRAQLLASRQDKLERFREKKRNRHFKKTIRYASRKAYAEVRPRIKGRFARKDEVAAMRAAGMLPPV